MSLSALGPSGTIAVIAFVVLLALYAYGAWVRPRSLDVVASLQRHGRDFTLTVTTQGELHDVYVRGDRCWVSDGLSTPARSMRLDGPVSTGESVTIVGHCDQGQEARAKVEVKWHVPKDGRTWLNGRRYFLAQGRVQRLDPHVVQSNTIQPDRWLNDRDQQFHVQ